RIEVQGMDGTTNFVFKKDGTKIEEISRSPDFADWTVDAKSLAELLPIIERENTENKVDVTKPQFEVDAGIDKLLAGGVFQQRTRKELLNIKDDLVKFYEVLNQQFE